jgi:polyphosphate kinase 2 (PPK2 family)
MAKTKKQAAKKARQQHATEFAVAASAVSDPTGASTANETLVGPPHKMKEKEYQRELRRLHGELVAMQEWVKASAAKVCVVFEGRDTAGKGGTIKAI